MLKIIQGLIIGFIIVLPGMSGGTAFLIFGIYEKVISDIAKLNFKPYLPLVAGLAMGIYLGGVSFTLFFQNHRDAASAFLLGCLLASVKPVLANCPKPNISAIISIVIGLLAGFIFVDETIGHMVSVNLGVNWFILMLGGALSSAAMLIPGIPGSSVLMILGIYDSMLFYVAELHWLNLSLFGVGSLLGILLLANTLNVLYQHHRVIISYFFAGIIVGSSRGLLPGYIDPIIVLLFLSGFSFIWVFSTRKKETETTESQQ